MTVLFKNANVVDAEKGTITPNAEILVEDGKIKKISSAGKLSADKVVDVKGMYASPGLINLHAHLFGTGKPSKALGGGKAQQRLIKLIHTPLGRKVLSLIVRKNAENELMSGVTTIRCVGDFLGSDIELKKKTEAGKGAARGLRMFVSGHAITVPGGHGAGTFALTGSTPRELEKLVDDAVAAGADFIKICITGGVMDAKKRGEPGEVKMNTDEVKAVCDRAHALGKKVAAHVQSTLGAEIAAKGGVDTIEHGAKMTEESLAALRARGGAVVVTYTPALPLATMDPEVTKLSEIARFNSGVVMDGMTAGAKQAAEHGLNVGMGTDASCPFCTQYNTWREAVYFSHALGVSAAKALYTITMGNALILGIVSETGSLSEGKSADIIFTEGDPLRDLRALGSVKIVVASGRVITRPKIKRIKAVDEALDKLMEELK